MKIRITSVLVAFVSFQCFFYTYQHATENIMSLLLKAQARLDDTVRSNIDITSNRDKFHNSSKDFGISIEGAEVFLQGCKSYGPFNDSIVPKTESLEQYFCKESSKNKQNYEINFFSSAVGEKYENVLPMYAFYALHSNENSIVEMVVKNATHFVERKYNLLKWLSEFALRHSGQICVRD